MKKSCGVFLLVLLIIPLMAAASTELKIKTVPLSDVQLAIYDASKESITITERYNGVSDEYGDVSNTFEIAYDEFSLIVFVDKDGERLISNEKFLDNPSGGLVYLEAPYGDVELFPTPGFEKGVAIEVEAVNETLNTTETTDLAGEGSKTVASAFSIFGEEGILSKKNFYYIGGFLLLMVVVGFVVASVKHKINLGPKKIKVTKLSEMRKEKKEDLNEKGKELSELKEEKKENLEEKKEDIKDYKQVIEDAEKKIAEAQTDIKKIKNEEKIKDMKKKIAADEEELGRLREGRD